MRMVIDKIILPPSFPLKWGKDDEGVQKGKGTAGAHWEHWKFTSLQKLFQKRSLANTYLCWGQFW